MSLKQNDNLKEHLKELQEENDKREFFPFMNQREFAEAMLPNRIGVEDKIRKDMEGGLGKVCGHKNPLNDIIYNDPRYDSRPELA